ncbi:MAG: hypothetical protein WCP07_03475 [bacterium]|jgi:hypothetical protein
MMTLPKDLPPVKPIDKTKLARAFADWAAKAGIPLDMDVTPEQAQEQMRADGVRPEDNILSSELLRMRYPEDYSDKDDEK